MKKLCIAAILAAGTLAPSLPVRAYVISMSRSTAGNIVQHKWKSSAFPIRWQMNPVQSANVTGSRTAAEVFAASFATWQSVPTAAVAFVQGANVATSIGLDDINLITTNTSPSDLPAGVLALSFPWVYETDNPSSDTSAGQISEVDIAFSAVLPFTTNATAVADSYDLQAVMTHEIGHFLGLDHSAVMSASMFWSVGSGLIYQRTLSGDDIAAISLLYASASAATKGKITGVVRTTANAPVYGAVVVAVNGNGAPAGSAITDPNGAYTIEGLDAGSYTVYAEPLDGPISLSNIGSLLDVYPTSTANSNFTTRFR